MIDDWTIRKIKDAANIMDVIDDFYHGQYRKSGTDYVMLCPFHPDRHMGNFKISPRRNRCTCFSCGKGGDPIQFLMLHENLTYPDAIRWLGRKYGIEVEGAEKFTPKPCKPHTPPPPLKMLVLPLSMAQARANTSEDILCNWIRALPWDAAQRARIETVLSNYLVGHAKTGHTIFWQIDEQGRLRTGKMMLYKPDGHRNKDKGTYNFDWIHSILERNKLTQYYDTEKYDRCITFFGMHLLNFCPNATINLVESEKTALLMSIAYGDMTRQIWMATGGKEFLNREKMRPIIESGRNVVLYPDHDSEEEWQQAADAIGYKHMTINCQLMHEYWKEEDGPKADIADVLVRIIQESAAHDKDNQLAAIMERMPIVKALNKHFNLEIVNNGRTEKE